MYLLDANICIGLLKGKDSHLISRFSEKPPTDFVLCSVVKAELLYGARYSERISDNLALLENFFSQFESFAFDDKAAEFYGINRAILTKAGTPIGANDLLIASIALANALTVLTRNHKEFLRVPGLSVETW